MKKNLTTLLLLLGLTACVWAQKPAKSTPAPKPASGLTLKNGDVLVYEVSRNGESWHFEVTIKEIREAIVFDWIMPEKNISGQVTLEKSAREKAVIYQNYFADSTESDFVDTSTVWLSKKNFNEIKRGSTIMTIDQNGAERFDKKETSSLGVIYKGKGTNLRMIRLTNGQADDHLREIWVLDQASQPLILQMNMGFKLVLKEIKGFKPDY